MDLRDALRRPRLLAAAACFTLGAAILLLGLLPRQTPAAPAPLDLAPLDLAPLDPAPLALDEPPAVPTAPAELVVYVTGAVPRPDVYRLAPNARVKDAVLAAGGLAPDAAAERVNLAEPLSDAAHVHIPALAELTAVAPVLPVAAAVSVAGAPPAVGLLNLNTATAADLEELPGIGATIAGRILARREEAGPFAAVEDLREVTGVGEKLFAQIAPLVTAGP